MIRWYPDKDPADIDYYKVIVDPDWLGNKQIDSAEFDADPASNLVISQIRIQGNQVSARVSGGIPGTHGIDVTISSDGRTRERKIYLVVKN